MKKRSKKWIVIIILVIILFARIKFPLDLILVVAIIAVWGILDKQVAKFIKNGKCNGKAA